MSACISTDPRLLLISAFIEIQKNSVNIAQLPATLRSEMRGVTHKKTYDVGGGCWPCRGAVMAGTSKNHFGKLLKLVRKRQRALPQEGIHHDGPYLSASGRDSESSPIDIAQPQIFGFCVPTCFPQFWPDHRYCKKKISGFGPNK